MAIASHQPGHVTLTGGGVLETKTQTDTAVTAVTSPSFVLLSGSEVTFSVPSGSTRLFNARFTAESGCFGPQNTWCTARIVGRNNSTGFVFELNPQGSTGFAFDQADRGGGGSDSLEAHAMERSRRVLTAGSYTFFVQVSASDQGTVFSVGIWHFTVDKHS